MCIGPSPPDPYATANAQQGLNTQSLNQAAQLNQINQTGPLGSINYSGDIGTPDRTQTTTLSPELQQLLAGQTGASNTLTGLANQRLNSAPGGSFQLGQNPVGYLGASASNPLQTHADTTGGAMTTNVAQGPIATGFDPAGQVQRGVNTDFAGQARQAQDANYAQQTQYLDPQFQQQDQALQSRLAAQGITQGSDAYNQAMQNQALSKQSAYSDARNQAIGAGNAEQNTLFGQSLGAGQFSNQAVGQQYGMNQGQAAFQNQAQGQIFGQGQANAQLNNQAQNDIFGQNLSNAGLYNQAQGQMFNQGMAIQNSNQNLYQQNLANQILGRNQNINEAMSYLNGTPISPQLPSYQPVPGSQAAQTAPNIAGLAQSNYASGTAQTGALLGSIFGAAGTLGAGAMIGCWVAREVFGAENPEWLAFREWASHDAPRWLWKIYLRHGARFAEWLHDKPRLKGMIRTWMTGRINASA